MPSNIGAPKTAAQLALPTGFRTGFTHRLARAIMLPLIQMHATARALPALLDYQALPAAWLDWFMYILALPDNPDLSANRKRALIRIAVATWVTKGVPSSIQRYLRALTGLQSTFVTLPIRAFIAGVSTAGEVCGVGGWRFEVHVPGNCSLVESEIRRALTPVVPVFCRYTVLYDLPDAPADAE